jgi:hypothetical protein
VTRSGTRVSHERIELDESECLSILGEDADHVTPKIWHQDILAGGIDDHLVEVGAVLAEWHGAGLRELWEDVLDWV